MIVSAIEGRMRFVHPALQKDKVAGALEDYLLNFGSVNSAKVNRITGSLIVLYEGNEKNQWAISLAIKRQLKKLNGRKNNSLLGGRGARKAVKFVMAGSITGSMAILFAGSERWHYRIGTMFLTFLGLHLYQNRRTFWK